MEVEEIVMGNIIITLVGIFIFLANIYYMYFILTLLSEEFRSKKEFIFGLWPFGIIIYKIKEILKELK